MKKIKEKFLKLLNILKKSIEKFPLTMIAIIVLTVIFTINLDNDFISDKTIGNISLFVTIFASSTFLIETLIKDNIKNRVLYYMISAFWSLILTFAVNLEGDVLGIENQIFIFRIARLIGCFITSIVVLGIYFNYKNSGKSFEEYVTKTVISLFKTSIVYAILAIGISIVSAIFVYLILSAGDYMLVFRLEILLFGIYYIPTIIYSFYNQDEEVGKFAEIVIKYVLGILEISAFVIIYMYILKIIILRDMPSNQIFRILSALFLCGLPIWTMGKYFKEDTTLNKINNKLPVLFIPFIFLQIYSIGVRIIENGFTEARYLCVMLIIFEIIYITMYIKNKEKIGNILIVFVTLTIISIIVPYVNCFKISILSQVNNLKIYTTKTEFTDEESEKIYGAYKYLKYSVEGEKYIEEILTEEDIEKIKEEYGNTSYNEIHNEESIYANSSAEYLEIEGYKKLYNIDTSNYKSNKKDINTFKNIKFDIEKSKDTIEINIEELVKKWIDKGDDIEKYFDELNEIVIDGNKKVIFNNVSIRYEKNSKKVLSYSLSGYLLEK